MAQYYGTYSCGHQGWINVIGPRKNRKYIIEKKFRGLCPDCYQEVRKKDQERAKKIARENEYPDLEGSEKQIEWAISIRQNFMELIGEQTQRYEETGSNTELGKLLELQEWLIGKTSAKWWINHRYRDVRDLEKSYRTELQLRKENQKAWIRFVKGEQNEPVLAISWEGFDNELYQNARKLPGAKWDKEQREMRVPVQYYRELQAFAVGNGFQLAENVEVFLARLNEYTEKH